MKLLRWQETKDTGLRIDVRGTYFFVGFGELSDLLDAATAKEREACAKLCEQIDTAAFGGERPAPNDCAAAIRARGEA
jgi:hypothetical protein